MQFFHRTLNVHVCFYTKISHSAHLAILKPLAKLGLFGMVEPLDFDYHAAGPGLPEALNATYIG